MGFTGVGLSVIRRPVIVLLLALTGISSAADKPVSFNLDVMPSMKIILLVCLAFVSSLRADYYPIDPLHPSAKSAFKTHRLSPLRLTAKEFQNLKSQVLRRLATSKNIDLDTAQKIRKNIDSYLVQGIVIHTRPAKLHFEWHLIKTSILVEDADGKKISIADRLRSGEVWSFHDGGYCHLEVICEPGTLRIKSFRVNGIS
jgi:hypothetical protein